MRMINIKNNYTKIYIVVKPKKLFFYFNKILVYNRTKFVSIFMQYPLPFYYHTSIFQRSLTDIYQHLIVGQL